MPHTSAKNTEREYHTVSVQEAQANPEYWGLVQHAYQETAVRRIQQQWRRLHREKLEEELAAAEALPLNTARVDFLKAEIKRFQEIENKARKSYQKERIDPTYHQRVYQTNDAVDEKPPESAEPELPQRFLLEPRNNNYQIYANKIKVGDWISLMNEHGTDPDFVRSLYHALRVKEINLDELATAWFLYTAHKTFPGAIRQHKQLLLDQNHLGAIDYLTEEQKQQFQKACEEIPENLRCYFTLDFSCEQEKSLLISALSLPKVILSPYNKSMFHVFLSGLERYILRQDDVSKQISRLPLLNRLRQSNDTTEMYQLLSQLLKELLPPRGTMKTQENIDFIISLLAVSSLSPLKLTACTTTPQHLDPILCLTLMPPIVLKTLCEIAHGPDFVRPAYTTGAFAPGHILELALADTQPLQRPVELTHPDAPRNRAPHEFWKAGDFLLAWHDLFHVWNSSEIPFKPFLIHLIKLLQQQTGYTMSKAIWALADMDFRTTSIRKNLLEHDHEKTALYIDSLMGAILTRLNRSSPSTIVDSDITLLLLCDMLHDKTTWCQTLGCTEEKFDERFRSIFTYIYGRQPNPVKTRDSFLTEISEKKNVLNQCIDELKKSCTDSVIPDGAYIIAYRLGSWRQNILPTLVRLIEKDGALFNQIFAWERNGGLYFRSDKTAKPALMNSEALHNKIQEECNRLQKSPSEQSPTTSPHGNISRH